MIIFALGGNLAAFYFCNVYALETVFDSKGNGTACIKKNVNDCLNTNIYSCLWTSGGQSYSLYLNVVHFFNASVN
jgi:hypothetical protein